MLPGLRDVEERKDPSQDHEPENTGQRQLDRIEKGGAEVKK